MTKQFAEKLIAAALTHGGVDLRRGNPARVARQSDVGPEVKLMDKENDQTRGFHPVWIVLPMLAVILIALIVALPVLYVTRDYAAQHDPTVKALPGAMLEQPPDRKSTAAAVTERN
jgi:hypothetical protein